MNACFFFVLFFWMNSVDERLGQLVVTRCFGSCFVFRVSVVFQVWNALVLVLKETYHDNATSREDEGLYSYMV